MADRLTEPLAHHGHGPVWDAALGRVAWVDATGGRVLASGLDGATRAWAAPESWAAGVRPRRDGGHVVVGARDVWAVDLGDADVAPSRLAELPAGGGARSAGAACAPDGTLLVVTFAGGWPDAPAGGGRVLAVRPGGAVDQALGAAAGGAALVAAADGTVVVADAAGRCLVRHGPGGAEALARFGAADGRPGGLCLDAGGALWVALSGAGRVVRITPDGRRAGELRVPVRRVTGCALAGDDGRTLVLTTSAYGCLPGEEPHAGALFAAVVDVPGAPVPPAW